MQHVKGFLGSSHMHSKLFHLSRKNETYIVWGSAGLRIAPFPPRQDYYSVKFMSEIFFSLIFETVEKNPQTVLLICCLCTKPGVRNSTGH